MKRSDKEIWKDGGETTTGEVIGCLLILLYMILFPIAFIGSIVVFLMELFNR